MSNHWRRRSLRLAEYDYAQSGAYFVTIVTQGRLSLFGSVVDGDMQLNEAGCMVGSVWCRLSERFPSITLDEFIVMPNHVHGLLFVEARDVHVGAPLVDALPAPEGGGGIRRPSLGEIVGAYKSLQQSSTSELLRTQDGDRSNAGCGSATSTSTWYATNNHWIRSDSTSLATQPCGSRIKRTLRSAVLRVGDHKGRPYRSPGGSEPASVGHIRFGQSSSSRSSSLVGLAGSEFILRPVAS